MSYSSRVYRQRNAHTHDEGAQEAFFSKSSDIDNPSQDHPAVQTKLSVNEPGDKYEKEADAVAQAITSGNRPAQQAPGSSIQRLSSAEADDRFSTTESRMKKDKDIQTKPQETAEEREAGAKSPPALSEEDVRQEDQLQKKSDPEKEPDQSGSEQMPGEEEKEKKGSGSIQQKNEAGAPVASPALSSKIEASAGKGKSLEPGALQEMSTSLGANISDVKVHDDTEAAGMNNELKSQAFTHGKDIYFNNGKYDPDSKQGKNLLAHELTHVVQQNGK